MAATNDTMIAIPTAWTQVTTADVATIRLQNQGGFPIHIMATVGAVPPVSFAGSVVLPGNLVGTLSSDITLALLFPGVTGGNRLYARSISEPSALSFSHA
jgi:hypothetical protein